MTTTAQLQEFVNTRARVVPLSVEQYHQMIRQGILIKGAPIELLDGFLVRKDRSAAGKDPMTVGNEHAWVVGELVRLAAKVERLGARLRIQQPVTLPPDNEPEPDGAIVRGDKDYRKGHPLPEDVSCLIEVADSSVHIDRATKQRIYADNGIAQYVIINLVDKIIEEYRQPRAGSGRYATPRIYRSRQKIKLEIPGGKRLTVAVASLLP